MTTACSPRERETSGAGASFDELRQVTEEFLQPLLSGNISLQSPGGRSQAPAGVVGDHSREVPVTSGPIRRGQEPCTSHLFSATRPRVRWGYCQPNGRLGSQPGHERRHAPLRIARLRV
jgi:hypothetical protein